MKKDSRLSMVLHALLHMEAREAAMTSDELALCLDTNPVVVRRVMAGLREAGLVTSEKGHGGGWRRGRPLPAITLLDVYTAIGEPPVIALGNRLDNPGCLIEKAINTELDTTFDAARALVEARLSAVTLADIWAGIEKPFRDFHARKKTTHDT